MKEKFMTLAIKLSIDSVNSGGGPFGCVIVKDNKTSSKLNKNNKTRKVIINIKITFIFIHKKT